MQRNLAEQRLLRQSIWATGLVSALGIVLGLLSGSLSIVFDGMFSAIDAAMSLLALFTARLVATDGSPRFQHGYWHVEPMVLACNGGVLMLLCAYAFINAVGGILEGGRELALDWALGYAVLVGAICFSMFFYERRANRRIGSDFVRLDTQSWLMSALITSALLLAFVLAWAVQGTRFAHLAPYADPVVLAVLALCLVPVPIKTVRRALGEIFLVTPEDLDRRVREVMDGVVARHSLAGYTSYVAKVGRARFIEVHIVVPESWPLTGIATLDGIRAEIGRALGAESPDRWLTVAFTANPAWT